jgi:hypothetical protein
VGTLRQEKKTKNYYYGIFSLIRHVAIDLTVSISTKEHNTRVEEEDIFAQLKYSLDT